MARKKKPQESNQGPPEMNGERAEVNSTTGEIPQGSNEVQPEGQAEVQPGGFNEAQPEGQAEVQPEAYVGTTESDTELKAERKRNFWVSLPGIITEIAAIAAALGTIVSVIFSSMPASTVGLNPQIMAFDALQNEIILGERCQLSWQITDAVIMTINNGVGNIALNGQIYVRPNETTTYTLTAINEQGKTVTASVTVIVKKEPTIDFYADPNPISPGISSALYWNVTGAKNITIDHGIGKQDAQGSKTVWPNQTTTYTLTAENSNGISTKSVTLTVANLPTIVEFKATPEVIQPGEGSTLSWRVKNATTITLEGSEIGLKSEPQTGSTQVLPQSSTTYYLTATNDAGSAEKPVTIFVSIPPTIQFEASKVEINRGESVTLSWVVEGEGKIDVTITPGVQGPFGLTGSTQVSPTEEITYTLTATNNHGQKTTATRKVTVIDSEPPETPEEPVIQYFTADPEVINSGESSTLSWDVSGATTISIDQGIGLVVPNGMKVVYPDSSTTYTLTATNSVGMVYEEVDIQIVVYYPREVYIDGSIELFGGGNSEIHWCEGGAYLYDNSQCYYYTEDICDCNHKFSARLNYTLEPEGYIACSGDVYVYEGECGGIMELMMSDEVDFTIAPNEFYSLNKDLMINWEGVSIALTIHNYAIQPP